MVRKWCTFGIGKMGKNHLNDLIDLNLAYCGVDFNEDKKNIVEEKGLPFINENVNDYIDISRQDNNISYSYKGIDNEHLLNSDVWNIVTPSGSHLPIIIAGLEEEKDIFVEKPPVETVSEGEFIMNKFSDTDSKIGVNYIEKHHPAVKSAIDLFKSNDEEVYYSFHRRSKNLRGNTRGKGGGEGSRIILDDLVHDISEIDILIEKTRNFSLKDIHPLIENVHIKKWSDLSNGEYNYETDVNARFKLRSGNTSFDIMGSFSDPDEKRYFLAVNKHNDYGVFVNTLSREHIKPVTAEIRGEANIQKMLEYCRGGIRNKEELNKYLNKTNAKRYYGVMNKYVPVSKVKHSKPKYSHAPLYNSLLSFENSETPETTLKDAIKYQEIAERVYSKSDTNLIIN